MQAGPTTTLPEPDAESIAHSERCAAVIRDRIAQEGGSVSFGTFMHLALYGPGVGYYTSGNTKFGSDGDFVTAPEISPLFARVLARQCAEVLADIDAPAVLEYGAGSGRLAADLLEKLAALDALPSRYRILEVSPELAARQQELIEERVPQHADRVEWLSELPAGHRGVVVANEVLDALPVERFTRRDTVRAHRVFVENDGFAIVEADASDELTAAVHAIENDLGQALPDGYVSEVSLGVDGWMQDMLVAISEGFAFLFDYGVSRREYYAQDRSGGWLRCHFRHHAHNDALLLPGIQDITAWVDFTSVATSAVQQGATIAGYTSQAFFLINGGLDQELSAAAGGAAAANVELSSAAKMLTLPGSMGEHFKCLGLAKGLGIRPTAFHRADRTHTL